MRNLATYAALAALALSPAVAQTTSAPGGTTTNFMSSQSQDQWLASKVIGTNVVGPQNEKIGDINDLVLDKNGTVQAVVIGVGGFLGIGEKNVAVPMQSLTLTRNNDGDRIAITATRDQLQNAPKYEFYRPARQTTGTGGAAGTGGAGGTGTGMGAGGMGAGAPGVGGAGGAGSGGAGSGGSGGAAAPGGAGTGGAR